MSYQSKWSIHRDEILAVALRVKIQHPEVWNELKVPGQKSRRFINLVSLECIAAGIPAGVNLKRGGPEQSIDVIALPNDTGCGDSTGTYPGLEIVDLVGGAEGPSPSLIWGDVTQVTIDSGTRGGWKAGSLTSDAPSGPVYPSYEDLGGDKGGADITLQLEADYKRAGRPGLDGTCGAWQQRVAYDFLTGKVKTVRESIERHRPEWLAALGISETNP